MAVAMNHTVPTTTKHPSPPLYLLHLYHHQPPSAQQQLLLPIGSDDSTVDVVAYVSYQHSSLSCMAKRRAPGRLVFFFCAIDESELFHLEDFISLDRKNDDASIVHVVMLQRVMVLRS